ncbi:DinB family protein [Pedobacter cryoconitis]|uniref:DinB-like domain-containing protein n=1 Tax=Pedobacter cryoconitis TaxID=188932 RepID=A0A7X0MM25_9SPHI|nr:DinB family protein [Pedobacter cryoconitis]MBB6502490.1 hypothetical protein [Pedobacter cryoconitis]
MITLAIERLQYLCNTIPGRLTEIDERGFSSKPAPDKWSKKEIIGHLIDSATYNHMRFVRGQFEDTPKIVYDQNNCNRFNYYDKINGQQLISFWHIYNLQLIELIKQIPVDSLQRRCYGGGETSYSLEFIFNDYVEHLEHHLRQIVNY